MRTNQGIITNSTKLRAFTLIEMIGVLAVIAILAALLIPKVFEAIHSARIGNASTSIQTVKTAVIDHYARFGTLNTTAGGAAIPAGGGYDEVLLAEAFLDKPFMTKISNPTSTDVLLTAAVAGGTAATGGNAAYNLSGAGINEATGTFVVEALLPSVAVADARELSVRIDGDGALLSPVSGDDLVGRVKFADSTSNTTVRVYITHR